MIKLQKIYDKYGVCSFEFYQASKNLIYWSIHKNLHGHTYTKDFFNECYKEIILAFKGGYTTHYNKPVFKKPQYKKGMNIGLLIIKVVQSAMAKYISKYYRRDTLYMNKCVSVEDLFLYRDFSIKQRGVLCA